MCECSARVEECVCFFLTVFAHISHWPCTPVTPVTDTPFAAATTTMDFWRIAALSGASAVLLGAFGAHGLRSRVAPELLTTWATASNYHLLHSAVLLVSASSGRPIASALLAGGIVLFSGSLYVLVLSGRRWVGAITPVGGLLLAGGWLALALGGSGPGEEAAKRVL